MLYPMRRFSSYNATKVLMWRATFAGFPTNPSRRVFLPTVERRRGERGPIKGTVGPLAVYTPPLKDPNIA